MERSWEGGRKNSRNRKGWIEGDDKHVQDKGAILKEEILNEGAVIGGTQFKISHSWGEGSIGPRLVGEGVVQFRATGPWGSVRISGLRFQVIGCNMGESRRSYAGCRGSPQASPLEHLLLGESH